MNATFDCNSQNEPNLFIQIDATPRALLDWSQVNLALRLGATVAAPPEHSNHVRCRYTVTRVPVT